MDYGPVEAKEWAREHMHGVANVTLPTFSHDLRRLNERAIRHDVRLNIEYGFEGTLLVSEAGTTPEEYKQFIDICADEAGDALQLFGHGSFDTDDEIIDVMRYGETHGLDAFLFSFRPTFYPSSPKQALDYIAHITSQTDLGCIMFAAPYWNFGRLHPSGFPVEILDDIADLPTIIALKYESIGNCAPAMLEAVRRVGDKIIVVDPFEINAPVWQQLTGQQWLGTSQYEWYADRIPQMWRHLKEQRYDEAMAVYWSIHPARLARAQEKATWEGSYFLHRYVWKYMAWLNGFNGGPIRMPAMRTVDAHMQLLRRGLERSGIRPTDSPDAEFYLGRNPE